MKASEIGKFFFQYLLSPILLLIVGFWINSRLEKQKQTLQRIQITEDIIKNVFDDNPHKAFTLVGLLPSLLDDKSIIDTITLKVKLYYAKESADAAQKGDANRVIEIQNAAQVGLNPNESRGFIDSTKKDSNVNKVYVAKQLEQSGYDALFKKKDFLQAQKEFAKADSAYPQYHSAYEISTLIEKNKSKLNDPETKNMLLDSIKEKYFMQTQMPIQFKK